MLTRTEHPFRRPAAKTKQMARGFESWSRLLCSCLVSLVMSGCSSYGVIHNQPATKTDAGQPYSVKTWAQSKEAADFVFILNFSGGGTRAAAMAYGVLEELRDTPVTVDGKQGRLLDEVTHISSVSGGSFASAYYGLYGDRIFDDFENEFLLRNVQGHLTGSLLNPFHWFGRKGRTERSAVYYNKILFHDATFADMMQPGRPMIIINASDLAYGVRFSFIQDYFNLLCSDVREYPVAWAVTASSAVPVVFNPIVLKNYPGCPELQVSPQVTELAKQNDELAQMLTGLESYKDKENREFIHFVDGGITDNMGLRAMTDVVTVSGGPAQFINKAQRKIPSYIVVLSVNASTEKRPDMNKSAKQPSMLTSMNAMTDIQLHRYNAATVDQVRNNLANWSAQLSTPEHEVKTYFIDVSFDQVPDPQLKYFLNKVPTSFSLTAEQVDALIKSARELVRADPEYQLLLKDLTQP
ncbi:MAG: patatin-like phospholipase family protein [Xanthomonadales bacterium]|nr:patatin-like phospholipase family protein [Xanthomonadales bacterium]